MPALTLSRTRDRRRAYHGTVRDTTGTCLEMLRDRKTGALLELNVPHKVEGERFSGFITVFHGEQLLRDHGLRAHVCICGSFQERTLASAVFTGQVFDRPLKLPLPGGWIYRLGCQILRRWAPSIAFGTGSKPFFLAPVLGVASRVKVQQASCLGAAAAALSWEPPTEDELTLLGKTFPRSHRSRRNFFSTNSREASALTFEPGLNYSFHFLVERLDLETFALFGLPKPFNIRVDDYLCGQPLRLLGLHRSATSSSASPLDEPLWDIEIFSRRQVEARTADELAVAAPKSGLICAQHGLAACVCNSHPQAVRAM